LGVAAAHRTPSFRALFLGASLGSLPIRTPRSQFGAVLRFKGHLVSEKFSDMSRFEF
jgi:hypothetical protein